MKHLEGGWPENVDCTEADQVERYLKKANKVRNMFNRSWAASLEISFMFVFLASGRKISIEGTKVGIYCRKLRKAKQYCEHL